MKITKRQLKEILGDFIDYGWDPNFEDYYPSDYFHYNDILHFLHMNGEDASNPRVPYEKEELAQYKPLLKRQSSRLILLDKLDKNGHYDKYVTYLYDQIYSHAEMMQRRDQMTIKENKIKITKRQLKRIIREAFWNKYGQPIGSRYRGGELHQNLGAPHRPKEKFNQMRRLLRDYQRKCNWASLGNEMYMSGVWVKLAMGLLGSISCSDGTEEPVQCKIKFEGQQLIFDEVEDLKSFLNEPELLAMQKEETDKLDAKYGKYPR